MTSIEIEGAGHAQVVLALTCVGLNSFLQDRSIRARPFKASSHRRVGMEKLGAQTSASLSPRALAVNMINGAHNSYEEAVKGSISIGKLADFVVLSDDIFTVNGSKIKGVQLVRTAVGGKTVYQA